jgi:hypothetical protein
MTALALCQGECQRTHGKEERPMEDGRTREIDVEITDSQRR